MVRTLFRNDIGKQGFRNNNTCRSYCVVSSTMRGHNRVIGLKQIHEIRSSSELHSLIPKWITPALLETISNDNKKELPPELLKSISDENEKQPTPALSELLEKLNANNKNSNYTSNRYLIFKTINHRPLLQQGTKRDNDIYIDMGGLANNKELRS